MGLRCFLMLHDALHISDTRLCVLRSDRARLHSAGRERLDVVRDGTGMDLSQRDGTGLDWL